MGELGERLASSRDASVISVVVLTGGVPGFFVAHADLDDLTKIGRGEPVEGDPARGVARSRSSSRCPSRWSPRSTVRRTGEDASCRWRAPSASSAASGHIGSARGRWSGSSPAPGEPSACPVSSDPGAPPSSSCRAASSPPTRRWRSVWSNARPARRRLRRSRRRVAAADGNQAPSRPRRGEARDRRGLRLPFDEGLRLEGRLFIECQTGKRSARTPGQDARGISRRRGRRSRRDTA